MNMYAGKRRVRLFYRFVSVFIAFTFSFTSILPPAYAQLIPASPAGGPQTLLNLPVPGAMVAPSAAFVPVLLRGMTIHPENPLQFDFIVDSGNTDFKEDKIKEESQRLVKYFLASMTIPKDDLWVNLSPYESDKIIPEELGKTELGRDMLAQDYILKQLTASLMYPEKELGKEFWDKVYKKAREKYGTTEIPVDTFNKVWILPETATVYEHGQTVYIVEARLKVMLDSDYVAMQHETKDERLSVSSEIIKEIILPAIEKEVNEGQNFAPLRQIYHSLILAKWYKETIKNSLLSKIYVDQKKIAGVDTDDPTLKDQIYAQYMEAYKKGVFNYIKEDYDRLSHETIPRKYFSGGFKGDVEIDRTANNSGIEASAVGKNYQLAMEVSPQKDGSSSPIRKAQQRLNAAREAILPEAQALIDFLADKNRSQEGLVDDGSYTVDDAKNGNFPVIHAVGSPAPESFFNAADSWREYTAILRKAGISDKNVPIVITNGRGRGYRRLVINTMQFIEERRSQFNAQQLAQISTFMQRFQNDLNELRLDQRLTKLQDDALHEKLINEYKQIIGNNPNNVLNEAQVIKFLFELNGVPERDENGRQIIFLEQQSDSTFANMIKGYPVLQQAIDQTYGQSAKVKIHIIADGFHRLRAVLQAKRDLISRNNLTDQWMVTGEATYTPTFNQMDDEQLYFYLDQMIGDPDQPAPPFGEIGRLNFAFKGEKKLISFVSDPSFIAQYNHHSRTHLGLRRMLLRNYRDAKRQYDRLRARSLIIGGESVQGHDFYPEMAFLQGNSLTPVEIKAIRSRITRNNTDVQSLLTQAQEENIDLIIAGHLRGVDGPGSSLDLPEFQKALTATGAINYTGLPSTPTIASDFTATVKFEKADHPDEIVYVAADYGIGYDVNRTEISLINGRTPRGQLDAPAYIFRNIFGLSGVKITMESISPMALAGGMESSNVFNTALIAAASMFSGANLSSAEIFNLAVKLENAEFGGLTGGQGHLSTLLGGAYIHMWTSGIKDPQGNFVNPYSAFSVPFLEESAFDSIEEHMMLVQAGKTYVNGKAEVARTAALVNNMWTDLLRDNDPAGLNWHKEKLKLTGRYTAALRAGDFETAAKAAIRYVEIRDLLVERWLDLMLDAHLGINNPPAYAREYARKVFNTNLPEFEIIRDIYNQNGVAALRQRRLYTDGPIGDLVDNARQQGIAIMPLGAGGPGANLIALDPHGRGHLAEFLQNQGLGRIDENTARNIITGTGTLQGFMDFRVGRNPMSFNGFNQLGGVNVPALPLLQPVSSSPINGEFMEYNKRTDDRWTILKEWNEIPAADANKALTRFSRERVAQPYRGLTTAAWVEPDTEVYQNLVKARNQLEAKLNEISLEDGTRLGDKIAWVKPGSYHMTTYDLVSQKGFVRGQEDEEFQAQLERAKISVQQGFETLAGIGTINTQVRGIGTMLPWSPALLVRIYPQSENDLTKIYRIRDAMASQWPRELPAFIGHITLGYIVGSMNENEYQKFVSILEQYENKIFGDFSINEIQLREFSTMEDYDDPIARYWINGITPDSSVQSSSPIIDYQEIQRDLDVLAADPSTGLNDQRVQQIIADIPNGSIKLKGEKVDIIKVVNGREIVIRPIDMGIAHSGNRLRHRTSNAFIVTPEGKILLQRRVHNKAFALNLSIFGGHVPVAHNYEDTMQKEIKEELGFLENYQLQGKLIRVGNEGSFFSPDWDAKNKENRSLYFYYATAEELATVRQNEADLTAKRQGMTLEEFKSWLEEQQRQRTGRGEVWKYYEYSLEEMLEIAQRGTVELSDTFQDGEFKTLTPPTADLLAPLLQDQNVINNLRSFIQSGPSTDLGVSGEPGRTTSSPVTKKQVYQMLQQSDADAIVKLGQQSIRALLEALEDQSLSAATKELSVGVIERLGGFDQQQRRQFLGKMAKDFTTATKSEIREMIQEIWIEEAEKHGPFDTYVDKFDRIITDKFALLYKPPTGGPFEFSVGEFKGSMSPDGLIQAIKRGSKIDFGDSKTPIASLNELLERQDLYKVMTNWPDEAKDLITRLELGRQLSPLEFKRLNRSLIEANYPLETPKRPTGIVKPVDIRNTVIPQPHTGFTYERVNALRAFKYQYRHMAFNQFAGGIPFEIINQPGPLSKGGHLLILPNMHEERAQILDRDAIIVALSLLQERGYEDHLKIGFNSWGAWASQNHQHLQAVFYENRDGQATHLPVEGRALEEIPLRNNTDVKLFELKDYPVKALVFEGNNIDKLSANVLKAVKILQNTDIFENKKGVPHNLIFTKTKENKLRVYLFPRKFQEGYTKFGTGIAFFELGGELAAVAKTATERDALIGEISKKLSEQSDDKDKASYERVISELRESILFNNAKIIAQESNDEFDRLIEGELKKVDLENDRKFAELKSRIISELQSSSPAIPLERFKVLGVHIWKEIKNELTGKNGKTDIIGLVGGTGAGKSTVRRILEGRQGVATIDFDDMRKSAFKSSELAQILQDAFPSENMINVEGGVEQRTYKYLWPTHEKKLRDIIHPYIYREIYTKLLDLKSNPENKLIVIEGLTFMRTGMYEIMDNLWYLDASEETRLKRVLIRREKQHGEKFNKEIEEEQLRKTFDFQREILKEIKDSGTALIIKNEGDDGDAEHLKTQIDKHLNKQLSASPVSTNDLGGINMNSISLDKQGAGVDIQFDPVEFQQIIDAGIDGFAPVIINITPLPSILPLLGLDPAIKEDLLELSAAASG